jgi:RNA polymerase sigma-70 factor (ECF subfamily)
MTVGPQFEEVLAAARSGAEWAFAVLYRDQHPRLARYLAAHAPRVADDLASETWLAVARQLHRFSGDERAFRAWLFTIGRRRLIQHWREAGRRPSSPAPPEDLADRAAPDDPEAAALAGVAAREAARALAEALSPDQADVVLLRLLADLDVEQVAAILGKRPGTVRVLQHKALRRLEGIFSLEEVTP